MTLKLTLNGRAVALVVSCLGDGDTGGGLLSFDGQDWTLIDDVPTTGLHVFHEELTRTLWAPSQFASGTSILHYTSEGLAREVVVEGLTDPHDVLWDGQHYTAVSSIQDSICRITAHGAVVKRFQPTTGGDCWHLNSLFLKDGVLHATAFGRFEQPRGWIGHQQEGTGMLFRLDTGEDIVTGLCCPHSPRLEGDQWVVCNSARSELAAFTATGELVRRAQLQDWTRGVAFTDRYLLVGESVNRLLTNDSRGATIAILDRSTWTVQGRLRLPFREVYDLVLVSPELLQGVLRSPNAGPSASCPAQFPFVYSGA